MKIRAKEKKSIFLMSFLTYYSVVDLFVSKKFLGVTSDVLWDVERMLGY
jgi:hypothetical protein